MVLIHLPMLFNLRSYTFIDRKQDTQTAVVHKLNLAAAANNYYTK